jgi:hypothetical protein
MAEHTSPNQEGWDAIAEFSKVIVIDSDTRSASTATDRTLLLTLRIVVHLRREHNLALLALSLRRCANLASPACNHALITRGAEGANSIVLSQYVKITYLISTATVTAVPESNGTSTTVTERIAFNPIFHILPDSLNLNNLNSICCWSVLVALDPCFLLGYALNILCI